MKDEHKIVEYEAMYSEYSAYFIENDTIYINFTVRKIPDRIKCTGV